LTLESNEILHQRLLSACYKGRYYATNRITDETSGSESADTVKQILAKARAEVAKVIIEQQEVVDYSLIAIFTGNHILLEGVPGGFVYLAAR